MPDFFILIPFVYLFDRNLLLLAKETVELSAAVAFRVVELASVQIVCGAERNILCCGFRPQLLRFIYLIHHFA